jgi:hypothetical protein
MPPAELEEHAGIHCRLDDLLTERGLTSPDWANSST